jgi:phospholipase/carboxylesterase
LKVPQRLLTEAGANVTHRTLPVGHELSQADVSVARKWLDEQSAGGRHSRDPA